MSILHIFKGPSGEPELGRVLLGAGGANSIISPTAFQIWAMIHGAEFDIEKYCLAISALMVSLAPLLLSIGNKDKSVAVARQTQAMPPLDDKGGQGQ